MSETYANSHDFEHALEAMKQGHAAKLPEWKGYWVFTDGSIKMHCKDGRILDIKESEDVEFTLRNIIRKDWEIIPNGSFPVDLSVITLTFSEALRKLKIGLKVARMGWNGKGMFLWLKPETEIKSEWCKDGLLKQLADDNGGTILGLGTICMYTHDSTGRKSILTGWLASQSDLLSNDWIVVE